MDKSSVIWDVSDSDINLLKGCFELVQYLLIHMG